MKNSITVLLSAAGSPSMPGIIDCFKNNKERSIRVIGMDMSDEPSAKYLVDVFYSVPAATSDHYVDDVLDICKKEKVDLYFPNISAEVNAIAKRIDDFEKIGTKVSISNQDSVGIVNNKLSAYKFLAENGVNVPRFIGVYSVEEFVSGCKYMGYPDKPVCLKIVDGSGSRGVRIID